MKKTQKNNQIGMEKMICRVITMITLFSLFIKKALFASINQPKSKDIQAKLLFIVPLYVRTIILILTIDLNLLFLAKVLIYKFYF
jgi:hypothetical protein